MTASGSIPVGPGQGRSFAVGLDALTIKGMSETDAFSFIEYRAAAGVPGPPMHVHHANEEAFYILDGQVDFTLNGITSRLEPGSFVLVPRDAAHTFANVGTGPARWVGVFAPGRYLGLVEGLGAVIPPDGPPDFAAVAEVFARYDSEIIDTAAQ